MLSPAFFHQPEDIREPHKVYPFLRFELVTHEEAGDLFEMVESPYPVFPSIVVILTDAPKPEEALQGVEDVQITFVLNDAEFRNDLESDLDRWVSLDSNEEASFSVYESNHPIWIELHRFASLPWMPGVSSLRIPRIIRPEVSCGLSNLDHCYWPLEAAE